MWPIFLLASKSKSEALFKETPNTDIQVQTLSHLVTISTAFVKLEDSLPDPENTISVSYTVSDVNKLVEKHFDIFTKIDISLTH